MEIDLDDYLDDLDKKENSKGKIYILIIYDICDNNKRNKLAKHLQGYGFRVQKSAFEALLTKSKYQKLLDELPQFVTTEDSIKVYKMKGKSQVTSFGLASEDNFEEIILI